MVVDERVAEAVELVDNRLMELIPDVGACQDLQRAARYSLFSGGKRLRPLLTLASCEALGGALEAALTPACAVELIHTYSLIHDDLPCMDDDDFRRGKPTLHKVVSEGLAVLAGDFLLTRAFEVLATAPHLSAEQRLRLVVLVTEASGGQGMVGGQALEMVSPDKSVALLEEIHLLKTGALISVAIQCGALAARANEKQLDHLKVFGTNIGLAFQIVDDLLDEGESILQGKEAAEQRVQELLELALRELHELPGDTALLRHLANLMVYRKA